MVSIPRLPKHAALTTEVDAYLTALKKTAFSGESRADFASRLLTATDNSIYQILPQAVLFPKTSEDVATIFHLANQPPFQALTFSPRGGGTGTNGQSLSPGIIIDCSKYMNNILTINREENWVTVQPGVILDQLNAAVKPHNLFFAPNVAPSSRATLGGMINTDACGKGSRIYGRTSDHILELTWVLSDGTIGKSQAVPTTPTHKASKDSSVSPHKHLTHHQQQPGRIGNIYREVDDIITTQRSHIEQQFPKMPRFLTGYNLAKVYSPPTKDTPQTFDLNRILAGSEGTLAVITEAKLKLSPIPHAKELLVIHYSCFDDALKGAMSLLAHAPAAIETIDETILDLACTDEIYNHVKDFLDDAKAINLVEFIGEDTAQLQATVNQIQQTLTSTHTAIGYYRAHTTTEIKHLWDLRKRGVGLLGNRPGHRKPIAFMEDTAVPPIHLPAYVQSLKTLLNRYDLDYAMFGHVDVGCLHVRPALDMRSPTDETLIREISDQVVTLVRQYGGIMWAEHGRGFRSEYTPLFFGKTLHHSLRRIKAAFDPHNKLNPGKIVTPAGSEDTVVTLESPLRGHFDRQVNAKDQTDYEVAFSCNGNGACFNVSAHQVMCPSYKGSKERIHSPKGRASLLREWLRQLSNAEKSTIEAPDTEEPNTDKQTQHSPANLPIKLWNSFTKLTGHYDYSHEVYDALHGCLSCKACASQCPIHVDIPSLKSKFLQRYHTRYARTPRDYVMANIEAIARWQAKAPTIATHLTHNPLSLTALQTLGITHPPQLSHQSVSQGLKDRNAPTFDLEQLSQADPNNSVILLQDAFTHAYEAPIVLATYDLLTHLGFQIFVSPPLATGKPLHGLGFIDRFNHLAHQNITYITTLQKLKIPIIGIEPSLVLTYRDEYAKVSPSTNLNIQLPQEFLIQHTERFPPVQFHKCDPTHSFQLFSHCHEKALTLTSQQQWQTIFAAAGLTLSVMETGCCGMAGLYGYEAEHLETSRSIYQLSWEQQLAPYPKETVLATGLSCRGQVARFSSWQPRHPLQALQQILSPS